MPIQEPLTTHKPIKTEIKPYDRQDWKKGYESQLKETDYWIENIEGEIPPELNGTLFRNGPGLSDVNGQAIAHGSISIM